MILVDKRTGSAELGTLFSNKIKWSLEDLPFGDFAFEGNGPTGRCLIGVERKAIKDMMQSIRSGRFSGHQLPGMMDMYEFPYLIIEGIFRPNPTSGLLEEFKGKHTGWQPLYLGKSGFMYRELDNFISTIELRSKIRVRRASTQDETAWQVLDLYRYFNEKVWEEHRAHQAFNLGNYVEIFRPSLLRKIAKELPGIGWEKAKAIGQYFDNTVQMVNADIDEWCKIEGIGPKMAKRIKDALNNHEDEKE